MKKFIKILAATALASVLCVFGVHTAFAEDSGAIETLESVEIPESTAESELDSGTIEISDKQLEEIAEKLKDKVIGSTGLTDEDVQKLTSTIYGWFKGKVSESIIVIIISVCALLVTFAGVLITKHVRLKATDKQLNVLKTQYNNLMEILESFKGNAVADSVIDATKRELEIVRSADDAKLAKIEAEMQSVYALLKAELKAMQLAWGNKVSGVNETLAVAPTQGAVENLTLYNMKLENAVKEKYGDEAESVLAGIRKESGV